MSAIAKEMTLFLVLTVGLIAGLMAMEASPMVVMNEVQARIEAIR